MSDIERWMRGVEQQLAEFDRRIRSKPIGDPGGGANPIGPAGGALTGTYPNPSLASGSVSGGTGGVIADGTITHVDIAAANKDGAAGTPSMRTLGTGATQAVAGNDTRLSDARTPTAHQHSAADITSGTMDFARLPTGTTGSTVAVGNHTHTLSNIVAGGILSAPLVLLDLATAPGSIPAGTTALYFKTDGIAYTVDDSGVEKPLIPKPDQLHTNASLDSTVASTVGANNETVPSRLMPTGWGWFWSGGTPKASLESDETVTQFGIGRSLKTTFTAGASYQTLSSSIFAVTPGSLVTVSAMLKGNGPRAYIVVFSAEPTGTPDYFGALSASSSTPAVVPGASWQKLTHTYLVPSGHTQVRFLIRTDVNSPGGLGDVWIDETESSSVPVPPAQVIPGTISMWATASAPEGYLLCNGGTFSSTTYPTLAGILGDTYGTHSGTTYYLPDFRGRMPLGVGTAVPAVTGGTAHTLAQKGGEEAHALTLAENGPHTHTGTTGIESAGHTHTGTTGTESADHVHSMGAHSTNYEAGGYGLTPSGSFTDRVLVTAPFGFNTAYRSAAHTHSFTTAGVSANHTHSFTTSSSGSGTAHNVLNPYLGINFIIKT